MNQTTNKVFNMSYNLFYGNTWCTYRVMSFERGSYNDILNRIFEILIYTQQKYSKVLTIQGILHMPNGYDYNDTHVITRFFKSLNAKLYHQYKKRVKYNQHANAPGLHFLWVREIGKYGIDEGKPHYHFCLFINGHAYSSLGKYDFCQATLFSKVVHAWQSALEARFLQNPFVFSPSLVTFTQNGVKLLQRFQHDDPNMFNQFYGKDFRELFYRLSYFAKVDTKTINDGTRSFGSSRIPRNYEIVVPQYDTSGLDCLV